MLEDLLNALKQGRCGVVSRDAPAAGSEGDLGRVSLGKSRFWVGKTYVSDRISEIKAGDYIQHSASDFLVLLVLGESVYDAKTGVELECGNTQSTVEQMFSTGVSSTFANRWEFEDVYAYCLEQVDEVMRAELGDEFYERYDEQLSDAGEDAAGLDIADLCRAVASSFKEFCTGSRDPALDDGVSELDPEGDIYHRIAGIIYEKIADKKEMCVDKDCGGGLNGIEYAELVCFRGPFLSYQGVVIDGERLVRLVELLNALNPELDNHRSYFEFLTRETASLVVGDANNVVFKIYADEKVAMKETLVCRRLADTDKSTLFVIPSLELSGDHVSDRLEDVLLTKDEREQIGETRPRGYVAFNGLFILPTESERPGFEDTEWEEHMDEIGQLDRFTIGSNRLTPRKVRLYQLANHDSEMEDRLYSESMGDYLLETYFVSLSRLIGVRPAALFYDTMARRLYTLSQVHMESGFSEEDRKVIGENYHDFILWEPSGSGRDDLHGFLEDDLLMTYMESSMRQNALYEERRARGSLVFTHGDAKWDNWFEGILGDFGSCKFSTEYKDIAKSLLDSDQIFDRDVVDGYIELYMTMRNHPVDLLIDGKVFGHHPFSAIEEDFDSFRRNVYDAILTESVRTIHYKSPMPEKKELVDRLVKIAGHYAKMIREGEHGI